MERENTPTTEMINKAIEVLTGLIQSDHGDGIVVAKSMETALKLTAQLCVRGLLNDGMIKSDIARELCVKRDKPGEWLTAKHAPTLANLIDLVLLYRKHCKDYRLAVSDERYTD